MAKTLSGDFKVTTLKNPPLPKQAVTNKGIPVVFSLCLDCKKKEKRKKRDKRKEISKHIYGVSCKRVL